MAFDRKTLVIPDKTRFEEKDIVTTGDVVVGDRTLLQFGMKTKGRIFVGEHVVTGGDLDASDDIRIDIFSDIGGSVLSGGNVYLAEKVHVKGKLSLQGDLDVGDSVEIDNGFEAKGWINIRSPIPVVIYVFIYLMQLLKMGKSEEIERILAELEQNDCETIPISESFFFVPNGAIIGLAKSSVDCSMHVGKACLATGNFECKGNVYVDENSELRGSLQASENVFCGRNVKVLGNIKSGGTVYLDEDVSVSGKVEATKLFLTKTSSVGGMLKARDGVRFMDSDEFKAGQKLKRWQSSASLVDEVVELLE